MTTPNTAESSRPIFPPFAVQLLHLHAACLHRARQEQALRQRPPFSYVGLIAMAILSRPERRLLLHEIYEWMAANYPYFQNRGSGWRNSVRHNLSLNDCFVKVGRAEHSKGHYWTVHPAYLADFARGDYRRRSSAWRARSLAEPQPAPEPTRSTGMAQWHPSDMNNELANVSTSKETTAPSLHPHPHPQAVIDLSQHSD